MVQWSHLGRLLSAGVYYSTGLLGYTGCAIYTLLEVVLSLLGNTRIS